MQTRLSVARMCAVAGFSRVGYCRFVQAKPPQQADLDIRDEMQKIAVEWPSYGSRRVKQELQARAWEVSRNAYNG